MNGLKGLKRGVRLVRTKCVLIIMQNLVIRGIGADGQSGC